MWANMWANARGEKPGCQPHTVGWDSGFSFLEPPVPGPKQVLLVSDKGSTRVLEVFILTGPAAS